MSDLFIVGAALAGISVLWKNTLTDFPRLEPVIRAKLGGFSKLLLCGPCFTYWISLAAVCVLDPLAGWDLPRRFALAFPYEQLTRFALAWFALGFVAILFRITYLYLQEETISRMRQNKLLAEAQMPHPKR